MSPCFYGVDTPRRTELIAATHTIDEVRRYLGADTLAYLSLEGMLASMGTQRGDYCTSCYTGHYPVAFPVEREQYLQLPLRLHPPDGEAPIAPRSDREPVGS